MPIVFWASLEPWANAMKPAERTCALRKPAASGRRWTRRKIQNSRITSANAMVKPMIGDVNSGTMTLFQMPGRLSWSAPAPTIVAPSSPPISAWLLELGRPSLQVMRFQMIAPISAAATIACVVLASLTRPAPMVFATAVPANAPMKLNDGRHEDGVLRAAGPSWRPRWRSRSPCRGSR